MPKNYTLDEILNEYSGSEKSSGAKSPVNTASPDNSKKIQDTGFFSVPKQGSVPDQTITYSLDEIVQINAPEKRPSPSHRSGKFQVSDVSRPNVSYINSVKDVVKNPADLPPRATDEIKDYDGAVVTKDSSDEEYIPKVRKMSDSTRAKEMRSRRRKKKQPEFTYERESPDGVYTRPQKKKKKFVISHDDGKNKKADRMAQVNLSADADPEELDISIEQVPEMRTVNTDEPKKQESTIKDYDSFEDAKEIKSSITELKASLSFRSVVLSVLFVFSAFISLGETIGLPVPELLTPKHPAVFAGVQLIVVLLSMIVSLDTVKSGLAKLVKFRADTDSLAAFGGLASAAASIACIVSPAQVATGKIHIYAPIAILSMLINAFGKRLILKRAELNFDFASRERNKYAIFCVEDEIKAESFTRGTIGDFPVLAAMKRTNFLKDFSKYTFSADSGDMLCRSLVPFIVIFSALASIAVTFIKLRTFDGNMVAFGLSIFTLYISACSCMAMPLIANIPLSRAAKKYSRNHGVMLGYQSVEDFYDTNSVMTDATRLFPAGTVQLCSIKLFSDTKIDEALLDAASLTSYADSVLKELFSDVIAGKKKILKKVENFVYEDGMGICGWIDNKRILLGNRELMHSHNIEGVPTKTKETEFTENVRDALYLSVSGNLAAMFIIEITASPAVKKSMQQLEKHDMAVIIKTIDPFITINRISGLFDFSEELLKIIPARMGRDYDEETRRVRKTSTSLACSGKFTSFVNLLMSAKYIRKIVSSGIILQSVSALLGMGIVSLHCLLSAFADLSPAWLLVYNLICTIVTLIVIGVRKI